MIFGELRVVDDVPTSFAELVSSELNASETGSLFRLGCSGGSSGVQCFARLAKQDLDWWRVACYFVDERCVDPESPDANTKAIRDALGSRTAELAGFFAMSCVEGPERYAERVREAGGFDVLQLGVGPDGHTASLFPGAEGPEGGSDVLVIENADPSGRNKFPRMSLTYSAISMASVVVITAIGDDKAPVLREVEQGADLPISRVRAARLIWLADKDAASQLSTVGSS